MPKAGFRVITIKETIFFKARTLYDKKREAGKLPYDSFSKFFCDIVAGQIKTEEMFSSGDTILRRVEGGESNYSILVSDKRLNRVVEVKLRDGELYCCHDERNDCLHVGFAYSLPEVYEWMSRTDF